MNRPISLVRSDSEHAAQFSVPTVSIKKGTIDCGIAALPCCLPTWFHRFATPKVFLLALIFLGICQGSAQAYFAATLPVVQEIFGYPSVLVEWLLVSHDLFLGVFGFLVAHFGLKLHRAAWLGGLACLQGASCFLVIIPYLDHSTQYPVINSGPNLCKEETPYITTNLEIVDTDSGNSVITLIVLFVLQLLNGLANASFYSHGFSYLDDNVKMKNSPIYLAILIAIRMSSIQFGSFMAWSFLGQERSWWIGYPIIGSLLIIFGTIVATFPRDLLNTVMDQTVATILENVRASSSQNLDDIEVESEPEDKPDTGYFASMKRVLTNKILIVNTLSSVFMYMAVDNFSSYEAKFMEAEFYIPDTGEGFKDPWTSRLLRNILKFPIIAMSILFSGLFIAKFRPRTTRLAGWNVFTSIVVASIFVAFAFTGCEKDKLVGEYRNQLITPLCSRMCNCAASSTRFEPVCTQDGKRTYYSPCYAGCNQISNINNLRYYSNCTCGSTNIGVAPAHLLATEGACDNDNCAIHWRLFQSFSVFGAALLGTGYVGNLLITLRAVLPSDKAMAIAFDLCMAGILVHVPGKIIYDVISDNTCQYLSYDGKSCSLQNEQFGEILTLLTAILLLLSIIMDSLVVYFSRNLEIYDDDDCFESNDSFQMTPHNRIGRVSSVQPIQEAVTLEPMRPPRPRSSVRYSTAEEEPLASANGREPYERPRVRRSFSPQGSDGRPLSTVDAQRDVIEEFRQRRSIRI